MTKLEIGLVFMLLLSNYCWYVFFRAYRNTVKQELDQRQVLHQKGEK
jgi:hypothetical protein